MEVRGHKHIMEIKYDPEELEGIRRSMEKKVEEGKNDAFYLYYWQGQMAAFVRSRMNEKAQGNTDEATMFAASGLTQEAAEVLSIVTKAQYGKPQKMEDLESELADVLFYLIRLCDIFRVDLYDLELILREKLKDGHGWTDRATPDQPSPNMTEIREGGGAKLKS